MKFKTIIIDDEKPALDEMVFLLEKYPQIEVIGTANDGIQGWDMILEKRPDLVFLDIEMPGMSGLEVAFRLHKMRDLIQPKVVFTTAYDQFAISAFEIEAIDYLLKPIVEDRLNATIERITLKSKEKQANESETPLTKVSTRIPVDYKGRYKMLAVEKILYFTTEAGIVTAKTGEETYPVNTSLTDLEENLKDRGFFRCHRGYIVNLEHVTEVIPWFKGKYLLLMDDAQKSEVPVSRTYIKDLCDIFNLK